ncbi:fibronectin type III domain-containing protein, partial [Microbacterium sp. LS_15]|uniref:fibronectin type III domain-containing protein n=1 Tax=Microbacterium sp. LS_15 TaxID=3055790 RepID=UPI0035C08933
AVSWTTPSTPGSPVESYTLEISPAPPSGVAQKQVTGNSLTWEGLENGGNYQVRVQAHNKAPDPSSWSNWSASEVPAGPPLKPAAPTTTQLASVGTEAQMQVNWAAPNSNGDAIASYQLEVRNGGTVVNTLTPGAGATSQAVKVPTSETPYTYRIRAQNKAGWGEWSELSAPRRGVNAPGAPTSLSGQAADRSIINISYNEGARNGAKSSELTYQYTFNGGGSWQALNGNSIGGLTNGQTYNLQIRAVSTVDGTSYAGAASNVAKVIPFGQPKAPVAKAENLGQSVRLSWDARNSDNGRSIDQVQISIDGGGWQNVAANGSQTVGNGYEETHSIKVRAHATEGGWSPEASDSARTNNRPAEVLKTGKGASGNWPGECTHSSCAYVTLTVQNFRSPGNYTLRCDDGGQFGNSARYVPENGTVQLGCFYGNPGRSIRVYIVELNRYADAINWY